MEVNKEQSLKFSNIENSIKIINEELGEVRDEIKEIKNDISETKIKTAKIGQDVSWLKRFFWIVVTSSVGALMVSLLNLIIKSG